MTLDEYLRQMIRDGIREELRAVGVSLDSAGSAADPSGLRDGPMTTAQAARYCGFKTTAAIRKAYGEGRLIPLGKRGGKGTYVWSREALDAFLAGGRAAIVPSGRPGAPPENAGGHHGRNEMGREVEVPDRAETLTTGGMAPERRWVSRSRSNDGLSNGEAARSPANGEGHGRGRGLPVPAARGRTGTPGSEGSASERALQRIRGVAFRKKGAEGCELASAQTRENWELMLRLHLFPAFGEMYMDAISKSDVEEWLSREAAKVHQGKCSPTTVNNWLRFLRSIMNEAVDELGLAKNPVINVKGLDTTAHVTYTEEEPNALLPEEVGPFLEAIRDRRPQHLGMVALGFATGWRPSMMRPLRRRGHSADVLWDSNVVLARRSQTRGDEVREAMKNATRFRVTLPADVMAILRWHADRLPAGPMQESDLLFPSETGGFRSPTVLDKPFKDVCKHLSLGKKVTPKAMCRTFHDLARLAAVDGLVQRTICGHLTEEMTERYSSVAQAEVQAALGKVVSLAGYRDLLRTGGGKKRSGGKVVGKPITTSTAAAASPSQVPVTN